ncbi:hypothetical protein GIB67_029420 [Kingdonia uniflora]|uniref:Uncharacterized protein n=1 Tax=Kingdonia uniflora TaxID=39325 RepID=A0A7J7NYD7_9MAGN|nr:hypothetical protein GIB67_029420 [Kingdonia uniflora]
MGCLNSLYEGLENMEATYFKNDICKNMLLHPRNSYADQCRKQKLNIDDTKPTKYYLCKNYQSDISQGEHLYSGGGSLSIFGNMRCKCKQLIDHEVCLEENGVGKEDNRDEGVFVASTPTFIITNDLQIMPMPTAASLVLMKNLDVMDIKALEEMIFDLWLEQITALLRFSLLLKRPLTDLLALRKLYHQDLFCFQWRYPIQTSRVEDISIVDKKIAFKITVRKSIQKYMFTETEEGFINFLFSLLTFPLGSVLNFSSPTSLWGSISNLWCSAEVLNPKSSTLTAGGGYVTRPAMFMVTDDLVVTHLSPISWFSFLKSQNVLVDDLEERMVCVGTAEVI